MNMPCNTPYLIENPSPTGFSTIPVPCGKCYDCRMRLVSQWAFRLSMEEKICTSSHFVTLTYDTETVPITKRGFMSLDKTNHLKNYFKTLRNKYRYKKFDPITGREKYMYDRVPRIKYFAVGEYGFQKDRPHYHVILFNSHEQYIVESWPYGSVHVGNVEQGSIMYCLKYVMKDGKIPKHKNDDRVPEYRRSSQKLGLNYLTDAIKKYHRQNPLKPYITMEGGFKIAIPRYFREKIWDSLELSELNIMIAEQMSEIDSKNEKIHYKTKNEDYGDYKKRNTDYRTRIQNLRAKKGRD